MKKLHYIAVTMIILLYGCSTQAPTIPVMTHSIQPVAEEVAVVRETQPYHISESLKSIALVEVFFTKSLTVTMIDPTTGKMILKKISQKMRMHGTAVYLGEGLFLTAAHVAGDERFIHNLKNQWVFSFQDGKEKLNAKLVRYVAKKELALFKIDMKLLPKTLKPIKLNMKAHTGLRPGDKIFAIGHPLGFDYSMSEGIISAIRHAKNSFVDAEVYQHTAPINPGNSGGAIVNKDGELLGIVSFFIPMRKGLSWSGLGFAITLPEIQDFLLNYFNDKRQMDHRRKYFQDRENAKQKALEKAEADIQKKKIEAKKKKAEPVK